MWLGPIHVGIGDWRIKLGLPQPFYSLTITLFVVIGVLDSILSITDAIAHVFGYSIGLPLISEVIALAMFIRFQKVWIIDPDEPSPGEVRWEEE